MKEPESLEPVVSKNRRGKIVELIKIFIICMLIFGMVGVVIGWIAGAPIEGFLWGAVSGFVLMLSAIVWIEIGEPAWERVRSDLGERKLYAYLTIGIMWAIGISGFIALTSGQSSCEESSMDIRNSCVQYADDGYELSLEQMWNIFLNILPFAVVVSCLVSALMHSRASK